jgi:hypothetical protein
MAIQLKLKKSKRTPLHKLEPGSELLHRRSSNDMRREALLMTWLSQELDLPFMRRCGVYRELSEVIFSFYAFITWENASKNDQIT